MTGSIDASTGSWQLFCRYLVGTEDGYIHRCLCTHTEQYMNTYKGHMVRSIIIVHIQRLADFRSRFFSDVLILFNQ